MNIARSAVHRPVLVMMVTLIVIILGGISLSRLPIDLMPDITYPTLSVSTRYENASPLEMEELITRPVEEAMSAVPGVKEVSSVSSEGSSSVRVTFTWGTDLDTAANDLRDRLDRVMARLPAEADRPVLRKFDLASFPILILGASSTLDPVQARGIIDDEIKNRMERVPGVAAIDVWGGQEREIHVDLDPVKILALGIPLDKLVSGIAQANVNIPAGGIEKGDYEITLRTPGEFSTLDELRDTTVAVRNGASVKLGDIAEIADRWQKVTQIVRINGKPGMRIMVNKQSGANTVDVARRVLKEVDRINLDIPQITLTPIIDTSDYIQRSITNVGSSAIYGGMFAIFILLLFLRNLRSTVIISVAIPISIIATFVMMYFGGFTLNMMSLGGLALGVGMLVDNAIVVLENIYRHREGGEDAKAAAVNASHEVQAPIIVSTLTTLVVFLPLVYVRGMAGVMFRQLAVVVSFALACSLTVAITLIPMLASRFLKPTALDAGANETIAHRLFRIAGGFLARLEDAYKRLLHVALAHRLAVSAAVVLLLAGSFLLVPFVGTELMPQTDENEVRLDIEADVGTRLGVTDRIVGPVEDVVRREVPEARNISASIGGSPWRGGRSHAAEIRVSVVPRSERKRSSDDIAAELRRKLAGVPGATIRTRPGQGLFIMRMAAGGSDRVQVEIRGYDSATARSVAEQVKAVVEDVEGITDTRISLDVGAPEQVLHVDRAKAEAMKISVSQVAGALQTVVAGTVAGYFREKGDEFAIRVKLKDSEYRAMRELLDMTLMNAEGRPVVMRNVVSVQDRSGEVQIERKNQERVVTLSANVRGRDVGAIMNDISARLKRIPVPAGFSIGFGGDYEDQQEAFRELAVGLTLALILVYMVMACLYESLRDPLIVICSVPFAAIGVILMLFLTQTTFNVQSYIGCIMLGGIVVNNAILLVDTTNLIRTTERLPLRAAIEEAGRRRLRPILMTALTTTFGLLPMALGLGEGGEAQSPLARAVIGGLISSTLITLVLVPVVYSLFEKEKAAE